MALFESRELKRLRNENESLREEILELTQQISTLNLKLFKAYGEERAKELADRLDLSLSQKTKLSFEFSIEYARLAGVPENKILHDIDEIDKFFMPEGES